MTLTPLHRRFDSLPEPHRELVLLAVVGTLALAVAQPWSAALSLGGVAVLGVLIRSRVRYTEGAVP